MKSVALVIFDIGGTLVEDRGQVPRALHSAFNQNGIEVSAAEIRNLRGASKRELIASIVTQHRGGSASGNEAFVKAIYSTFQNCLEAAYENGGVNAIEGARNSISWLHKQTTAVAASTGFSRRITNLVLSRAGLDGLLDTVITGDDVSQGRPAPYLIFRAIESTGTRDVRAVINVGDTPLDLQAGRNAGVAAVVGVLTGVYSAEELTKHSPTHILPSVAALPELVDTLAMASSVAAPKS